MRRATTTRLIVGLVRMAVGAVTIVILGYTFGLSVAAGDGNPFDYFGYFTNQTSLLMGFVLVATGLLTVARRTPPQWFTLLRGVATAYLIVVAVIYNVLVPGTGTAPPWVSAVLHVAVPAFVVLDWLIVADRRALPWRQIWIALAYPAVWLVVVLIRGATDGWVPYGFLLPGNGPGSLILHIAGLIGAVMVAAALVWWGSRLPSRSALIPDSTHH